MDETTHNYNDDICGNCHHSIGNAKYCSSCGQKNTDGRISVREFFAVVFGTVFNLESKFFQTLRDIFIPGKLTQEWFKGRHKPYFHPVRLFIVTALLLIAVLSTLTTSNSFMSGVVDNAQKETYRKGFIKEIDNYSVLYLKDEKAKMLLDSLAITMRKGRVDSGKKILTNYGKKNNLPDLEYKSPQEILRFYENELGVAVTDSIINVVKSKRRVIRDSIELTNLVGDNSKQNIANEDFLNLNPSEIADKYQIKGFFKRLHFKQRIRLQKSGKNLLPFVLGNSLWVALLMMPFLAIILKLLYFRHDNFYVEHLIFSFHAHSFAFLLFAFICLFMKMIYAHPFVVFFGFILLFIYLYNSLRRVYPQGRWKTIFKLLFANLIYIFLFGSFAVLGILVSIFIF